VAAGLAGGSTDAAATLAALNKFWGLDLSEEILLDYAKKLGMDVPFCLIGGTALGTHFGEQLKKIKSKLKFFLVIVAPKLFVSTKEAYASLNLLKAGKDIKKTDEVIKALESGDMEKMVENLHNDFERPVFKKHPEVKKIKEHILKAGALGSLMSGSGPSVFGIWQDRNKARKAFSALKNRFEQVFLAESM
jgi:4-diphosphocytidyl-2-C-methyl-D-erythritol kinase